MFKTLINAFKVQDIRRRLLYTFFILVVVRLGSLITVPGISADAIREYMQNALGDSLNIFSSFTGGSFEQMSIFALSVTPYITASIIIQLLTSLAKLFLPGIAENPCIIINIEFFCGRWDLPENCQRTSGQRQYKSQQHSHPSDPFFHRIFSLYPFFHFIRTMV